MCYYCATLFEVIIMTTINIRRQGGAAIVTIPAQMLKQLNIEVGGALELDVADGTLTARPAATAKPRRFTLKELLRGATPRNLAALKRQTAGALDGAPVGRELA